MYCRARRAFDRRARVLPAATCPYTAPIPGSEFEREGSASVTASESTVPAVCPARACARSGAS